jgi:hypothetical protein
MDRASIREGYQRYRGRTLAETHFLSGQKTNLVRLLSHSHERQFQWRSGAKEVCHPAESLGGRWRRKQANQQSWGQVHSACGPELFQCCQNIGFPPAEDSVRAVVRLPTAQEQLLRQLERSPPSSASFSPQSAWPPLSKEALPPLSLPQSSSPQPFLQRPSLRRLGCLHRCRSFRRPPFLESGDDSGLTRFAQYAFGLRGLQRDWFGRLFRLAPDSSPSPLFDTQLMQVSRPL